MKPLTDQEIDLLLKDAQGVENHDLDPHWEEEAPCTLRRAVAEIKELRKALDDERNAHELTKLALASTVPPPPQTSTITDIFTA